MAALPHDVLVAVSGGVDSMALLHALVVTGRRPVVLHFDHAWRAESAAETKWLRDYVRWLRLKFITARARADEAGRRREGAARAERYAFFAEVARRVGIADLVLAHHADDQVETFLLQLLRGTGSAGSGMNAIAYRGGITLHRPWLALWKSEIAAYARVSRLDWREDPTNADVRHRRNLVRRRLMPYLRRHFGTAVDKNLWRAAEIARAEGEWMDSLCDAGPDAEQLPIKPLRELPPAAQRRKILRWLKARAVSDISFEDVEAVRTLVLKDSPSKVNLSRGLFARRRAGRLFIESEAPKTQ